MRWTRVAVAALVVAAGCASVGGDGGSQSPAPPYGPPLDESRLLADHRAALAEAGTFTLSTTRDAGDPGDDVTRAVVRADLDSGAVYWFLRGGTQTRRAYVFGNGTGYVLQTGAGDRDYATVSGDERGAGNWDREPVADAVAMFEYEYAGTESVDGRTLHVYEAVALDTDHDRFDQRSDLVVSSATATLSVRPDGLVVGVEYEYVVDSSVGGERESYTARYTDLGATSLAPPAWLSAARNATVAPGE